MSRIRRGRLVVAPVGLATLASGCVVNPVTGRSEVSIMSPAEEERLGAEGAKQVASEMGLVEDSRVVTYVAGVGHRVSAQSPRQDVSYRFQVVDMPEPNAFALPGGYVYVSRGILALANSEAELAGVLGHEIAHVAARHAAQRQTRAAGVGLLALPGLLVGSLLGGPVGQVVAAPFALAGAGLIADYSRDQEREADRVGQGMTARAGEDPNGLATFLGSLERLEGLERGETRRPSFFDTHPATPERAANAATFARSLAWQPSGRDASRGAFLREIEGVLVGENPAQGVFVDSRFLHPELDFTIVFPKGWQTANTPNAVGAAPEKRGAQIVLQIQGPGEDPQAAGRALLEELGQRTRYRVVEDMVMETEGRPAYRVRLVAPARGGDAGVDFSWIPHRGTIYRITGVTNASQLDGYRGIFGDAARSFRPLASSERAAIEERRLRIVEARAGESLEALCKRSRSAWSAEEIAVANGLPAGASLSRGQLIKVAVPQPYRP